MEKNYFIKKILDSKVQDYSYAIAFFLVFSFFVYFVIRPNLVAIFKSLNKIEELKKTNAFYDNQVRKIIELQTNLEAMREDFNYINSAMPVYPEINKVFGDVKELTEKDSLPIAKLNFDNIDLKDNQTAKAAKKLKLNIGLNGPFENAKFFLNDLTTQLRLKDIKELRIFKETSASTDSSQLKIEMVINSYYL